MTHVAIVGLEAVAAFLSASLMALFGIAWAALISMEACGSLPILLRALVRLATLMLPRSARARYREEWAADLKRFEHRPISGLVWTIDCFRAASVLAWALRRAPRPAAKLVSSARVSVLPQQTDQTAFAHLPTVTALGAQIAAADWDALVEWIGDRASDGTSVTLIATSVSTLMLPSKDRALRGVASANSPILIPDRELSTHLKIRGYGDIPHFERWRLIPQIFEAAADQGWRAFIYGESADEVADMVRQLRFSRATGLLAGAHASIDPLDALERADTVDRINRARPDIVFVRLPYGAQIRWLADVRCRLHSPLVVGVHTSPTSLGWQVSISRPRLRAIYRASPGWVKRALAGWSLRVAFSEAIRRERSWLRAQQGRSPAPSSSRSGP